MKKYRKVLPTFFFVFFNLKVKSILTFIILPISFYIPFSLRAATLLSFCLCTSNSYFICSNILCGFRNSITCMCSPCCIFFKISASQFWGLFLSLIDLFCFWLCWVFIAAPELSLAVASSSFSCCGAQALGTQAIATVAWGLSKAHWFSCSGHVRSSRSRD